MSVSCRRAMVALFALCWAGMPWSVVAQVPGQVHVEEQLEYYPIHGRDLRELAVRMQLHGPAHAASGRRSAGTTHWSITWSHRLGMRDARCELESLDVHALIAMTLPQWDGDRGHAPIVREWRRFLSSLQQHEATHVLHGREAATSMREAMVAVPPQATCAQMVKSLQRAAASELRRHARLTRRYDTLTDYGATQGVRFEF